MDLSFKIVCGVFIRLQRKRLTMYKDELFEKCREMDLKIPPGVESEKTIRVNIFFITARLAVLIKMHTILLYQL